MMMVRTFILYWLSFYWITTLIAMAPMSIGAGAFMIVSVVGWVRRREVGSFWQWIHEDPWLLRFWRLTLILLFTLSASLVAARIFPIQIGDAILPFYVQESVGKFWFFILPFVIGYSLQKLDESQIHKIVQNEAWVFLALSLVGVQQFFTGWPREQAIPDLAGRFHAILGLGHHLSVASVWIFPFFILLDHRWPRPWLKALALLAGAVTLFFTFSRTLWVAFPIGLLVYAAIKLRPRWYVVLGFLAGGSLLSRLPAVQGRLHASLGVQDRLKLWNLNWQFFLDHPILGIGFRHNERAAGLWYEQLHQDAFYGHAHNNFIEILAGAGTLGILAFLAWNLFVLKSLYRLAIEARFNYAAGLFCAWIVFELNGMTQVNFWEGKVMHQMMWALGWMIYGWKSTQANRR